MPAKKKSSLNLVESKRQRFDIAFAEMENEFSPRKAYWRDLLELTSPMRGRFTTSETNRGDRKNHRIINTRPTIDLTILKAGMMSTITNPATNWVKVTLEDKALAEFGPVKDWLGEVTKILNDILRKSNLYKVLPSVYGDMSVVGTGALLMEEDLEDVIRFSSLPLGSYMISANERGRVDGFAREFRMTVRNLVKKFGVPKGAPFVVANVDWSKFSSKIKDFFHGGFQDNWVDICHMILPNEDYDPTRLESKFKRYASVYFEKGSTGRNSSNGNSRHSARIESDDLFLQETGFDMFPVLAPRWEVTGEDSYADNCPAIVCHGANRALQLMEKRKAQATSHKVNPATVWPTSMKKKKNGLLPGDKIFHDEISGTQGIRKAYEIDFDVRDLENDIIKAETQIDDAFHRKAFLAISDLADKTQRTIFEIQTRLQEARGLLGNAVQNVEGDLLEPLVDALYVWATDQGKLPDVPQQLEEGTKLKIEFIGVMAQSQRSLALGGLRDFAEFVQFVSNLTGDPEKAERALDKVDIDQMIDDFASGSGVSPETVRTNEEVAFLRDERIERQKAEQAQQALQAMAGAAKDLGGAQLGNNTALDTALGGITGE
jgi:hypothetical protein